MRCKVCGFLNDDSAHVCANCGAGLIDTGVGEAIAIDPNNEDGIPTISISDQQAADAIAERSTMGAASPYTRLESARSRRRKKLIIVGVVLVVLAVVAGSIIAIDANRRASQAAAAQAAYDEAHREYPVNVTVDAPGFDPSSSTPVPVRVEGADFEGNPVSRYFYVAAQHSAPVTLMRGSYTMVVVASPLTQDGTLFDESGEKVSFTVGDDGAVSKDPLLTLAPTASEKMTEAQITRAYDAALKGGVDEATADKYRVASTTKMQQAIEAAQKAAEEEAARLAAEQAAAEQAAAEQAAAEQAAARAAAEQAAANQAYEEEQESRNDQSEQNNEEPAQNSEEENRSN